MDREKLKHFTTKIFEDMAGAMGVGLAHLGTRTGLFKAMEGRGWMSPEQVVEASGLQSRYVEEWLKGMACAGYLEYEPASGRFQLSPEHAYLLASDGTDHFAGGLFGMAPALLGVAPQVVQAFKEGGGVNFEDYGEEGILALDLINRGNYENRLVDYWLEAMPEVIECLRRGARALDVGCGTGHVVLTLARAFPNSQFLGIDIDASSIASARSNAQRQDLAERATFRVGDVSSLGPAEEFDLISAFDCVHDLADPLGTLRGLRRHLHRDGTVFVVEPKAADRLEDNQHPIGAMFYGFSVFHCMTQSLARGGPGLGTCLGPARTEALMLEAGFSECRVLDLKSQVNSFYAVR